MDCRNIGMVKNPKTRSVTCVVCGKTVEKSFRDTSSDSKLCSKACIGEFNRRRISGTRSVEREVKKCAFDGCQNVIERRVTDIKKRFCSKKCRSLFFFPKIKEKMHSGLYFARLRSGEDLKVRSKWEAVFVEDFLEAKIREWQYEPKAFLLPSGNNYYPDFYLKDMDLWVEIKGCKFYDKFNKTEDFQKSFPELNYVVADAEILEERFGLNLSQKRLSQIRKAT